jgi:hypothetical protein
VITVSPASATQSGVAAMPSNELRDLQLVHAIRSAALTPSWKWNRSAPPQYGQTTSRNAAAVQRSAEASSWLHLSSLVFI